MYTICPKCSHLRRKSASKSLSVRDYEGRIVVKCFHADACEWNSPTELTKEELEALELEAEPYVPPIARPIPRELIPPDDSRNTYYRYVDKDNEPLLIIQRIDDVKGKRIFPLHYDGEHLQYGMPIGLFLYGRQTLVKHPNAPVLIVEGEKAAQAAYAALQSRGVEMAVVTWPLGSSNVLKGDWKLLQGRSVILWPDNDEAGAAAMRKVKEILIG